MIPGRIVLASASPRRGELLRQAGVACEVRPVDLDESVLPGESPERYVLRLAEAKARAAWAGRPAGSSVPVLAADTTVVLDGRVPIMLAAAGYSLIYLLMGGGLGGAILIFIVAKMLGK